MFTKVFSAMVDAIYCCYCFLFYMLYCCGSKTICLGLIRRQTCIVSDVDTSVCILMSKAELDIQLGLYLHHLSSNASLNAVFKWTLAVPLFVLFHNFVGEVILIVGMLALIFSFLSVYMCLCTTYHLLSGISSLHRVVSSTSLFHLISSACVPLYFSLCTIASHLCYLFFSSVSSSLYVTLTNHIPVFVFLKIDALLCWF